MKWRLIIFFIFIKSSAWAVYYVEVKGNTNTNTVDGRSIQVKLDDIKDVMKSSLRNDELIFNFSADVAPSTLVIVYDGVTTNTNLSSLQKGAWNIIKVYSPTYGNVGLIKVYYSDPSTQPITIINSEGLNIENELLYKHCTNEILNITIKDLTPYGHYYQFTAKNSGLVKESYDSEFDYMNGSNTWTYTIPTPVFAGGEQREINARIKSYGSDGQASNNPWIIYPNPLYIYHPKPQVTILSVNSPTCEGRADASIVLSISGYAGLGVKEYYCTLSRFRYNPNTKKDDVDELPFLDNQYYPVLSTPTGIITLSGILNVQQGLIEGRYRIKVANRYDDGQKFCSTDIFVTVPGFVPHTISNFYQKQYPNGYNLTCDNTKDDITIVSNSGARPPYTYLVKNARTYVTSTFYTNTISGLGPGAYTLKINDKNNCSITTEQFSVLPPPTFSYSTTKNDARCNSGAQVGRIIFNYSSGASPWTSQVIDNGGNIVASFTSTNTTPSAANLPLGTYTTRATDANGCVYIPPAPITISNGSNTTITSTISSYYGYGVKCYGDNNGSVSLFGIGGTPPYNIIWDDPSHGGFTTVSTSFFSSDRSNLAAGVYRFYYSDANGCGGVHYTTISSPPQLSVIGISMIEPSCNNYSDGKALVNITGGAYNYAKVAYKLVSTTLPGGITIADNQDSSYAFSFLNNPLTLTGLSFRPVDHLVYARDISGCKTSQTFNFAQPNPVTVPGIIGYISCKDSINGRLDAAGLGGTPPYSYQWYRQNTLLGTGTSLSRLSVGTYKLVATDSHGCTMTGMNNATVMGPANTLVMKILRSDSLRCYGDRTGVAVISVTGGWNTRYTYGRYYQGTYTASPSVSFTGLGGGKNTLRVTDLRGCVAQDTAIIKEPLQVVPTLATVSATRCFETTDGRFTLHGQGGSGAYTYSANAGVSYQQDSTFTALPAGKYVSVIKDKRGCLSDTLPVIIARTPRLVLSAKSDTKQLCGINTGKVSAKALGGTKPYAYRWHLGGEIIYDSVMVGLYSGIYNSKVVDAHQCVDSAFAYVADAYGPTVSGRSLRDATCYDSPDGSAMAIAIGGTPPLRYYWQNGRSYTPTVTGIYGRTSYIVTVTDSNDCVGAATWQVDVPDSLLVTISATAPVCNNDVNGSLLASVRGGVAPYRYAWDDPARQSSAQASQLSAMANTRSYLQTVQTFAGYRVMVTDKNNCTTSGAALLINPDKVSASLNKDSAVVCQGQQVTVFPKSSGPGWAYQWQFENKPYATSSSIKVNNPGSYTLTIRDQKQCTDRSTFKLSSSTKLLDAQFAVDGEVYEGDTVVLVELSWPAPDSIGWQVPRGLRVMYSQQEYLYIIADSAGIYNMSLQAYLGECAEEKKKNIVVNQGTNPGRAAEERFGYKGISYYRAYPNPATEKLNFEVKLANKGPVEISILSPTEAIPIAYLRETGKKDYVLTIPTEGLLPGLYFAKITGNNSTKVAKIVVSR